MVKINSRTCGTYRAVSLSVVFIGQCRFRRFRRKYHIRLFIVAWHRLYNAPLDICLAYIRDRLIFQKAILIIEETLLPVCKLFKFRTFHRKHRTALLYILFTTAYPSAFTVDKNERVETVLLNDVLLCCHPAVIPEGRYGTHYVAGTLFFVINRTSEQSDWISKQIIEISVIITSIYIGHTGNCFAGRMPSSSQVETGLVRDGKIGDRIPDNHLTLQIVLDVGCHYLKEAGISQRDLISPDMDVRSIRESGGKLPESLLQHYDSFISLHRISHSTGKCLGMTRHINFG